MNSHTRHRTGLLALSLILLSPMARAQDLQALLSSQRYSEAFREARNQPAERVIAQVERQAQGNDAPVQWILAEAYWRAGNKERSVQWGYTALVSTQLDASGCRYPDKIVPWMMQSYQYIFSEARRRPDVQSDAVKIALARHAKITTLPSDQAWACRLGVQLAGTHNDAGLRTASEQTIKRRRTNALKDLIKAAHVKIELADQASAN